MLDDSAAPDTIDDVVALGRNCSIVRAAARREAAVKQRYGARVAVSVPDGISAVRKASS